MALADLLHGALEEYINRQLGIDRPFERGRQRRDQRDGHYSPVLETTFGAAVMQVPRSRPN